jgi:hypothetical protein
LITVGSTDKDYRTVAGDVERATGTNFPEEYVDDATKEEKCEVIGKIRNTFLTTVRLGKLFPTRHHGGPQDGSLEAGGVKVKALCGGTSRE